MAASKKTVSPDNLVALGAPRLAAILVDLAAGNAEVKRRLRLELAGQAGEDSIAAEIGKRLTTIRSARSFIDWRKRKDFVRDLDLQRAMIADRLAATRPDLALDLMWRFLDLAEPVLDRVDDSNGSVGGVFRIARADLGVIATKAKPDPVSLADRALAALLANEYGIYDGLVPVMLPALGGTGIEHLKRGLVQAWSGRKAGSRDRHADAARRALQEIADGQSDVDAYIALVPGDEQSRPHTGAEIGRRLLAAGRAAEALAALEAARPKRQRAIRSKDDEELYLAGYGESSAWEEAYVEALDATGQTEQAQRLRWTAFEERLSATQLRAYLKRLPDFEDIEAEERAIRHVLAFPSFAAALQFLCRWPDQAHAAQLVLARSPEIDGNLYFLLDPAAQLIEGKHPLAATLLRRAMIEDTLNGTKATRYKHAVRHLVECEALAPGIQDFGSFETHEHFVARLHAKHDRKFGFWGQISEASKEPRR